MAVFSNPPLQGFDFGLPDKDEERRRWALEKALCLNLATDPDSLIDAAEQIEAYLKGGAE